MCFVLDISAMQRATQLKLTPFYRVLQELFTDVINANKIFEAISIKSRDYSLGVLSNLAKIKSAENRYCWKAHLKRSRMALV